MPWFLPVSYIAAAVLFILAIRGLASPRTARAGNALGMLGMLTAVTATLFSPAGGSWWAVAAITSGGLIGTCSGLKVRMTALPQMVAAFNGFGGLAAMLVALSEVSNGSPARFDNALGLIVGGVTFTGSLVAFAKLQGILSGKPRPTHLAALTVLIAASVLTGQFIRQGGLEIFWILAAAIALLGILLVLPIGGADMPVVISVLNSCSGWAAAAIGFSLNNMLLVITGAIIGAAGTILSYIMAKAMNRSLINILLGGFGGETKAALRSENRTAKAGNPQDAAFIMENANKVIIVPGYGMAVAQAQHVLQKMAQDLRQIYNVEVKYAIHPVAGRMPGHMNVLLAEAGVPYEDVFELHDINREFASTDVAYVIGANDITNPLAQTDPSSPIYGMPVLDVAKAKTVFFVKRSLGSGYSGVENPLFYADNTIMLYGDAKQITEQIVNALEKN